MTEELLQRLRTMPDAKKLAVAIYGESVASYRYAVLAEKSLSAQHRALFNRLKEEERGHQTALEQLSEQLFPESDFVLNPDDKDLVIVGTRMLQVTDASSFRKAMQFLHDTEKQTSRFYEALHELMPQGDLGRFLDRMARECATHARSLLLIEPP